MIDLHCHILPGIDDGAKNTDISVQILNEEKRQGVQAITFTPHFHCNRISAEKFLKAREHSYEKLMAVPQVQELGIKFKLGAEIYFSTKLNEMDLDPLCFTDTKYLLIELPTDEKPYGLRHTIVDILNRGYTPVLAHVERYPYFTDDPTILYDLIEKGCVVQINSRAITDGNKIALKYIKWGMAHLICSDTHNMDERSPNMKDGMKVIERKFGEDYVSWFNKNAVNVFKGNYVDLTVPKKPKKILGIWM